MSYIQYVSFYSAIFLTQTIYLFIDLDASLHHRCFMFFILMLSCFVSLQKQNVVLSVHFASSIVIRHSDFSVISLQEYTQVTTRWTWHWLCLMMEFWWHVTSVKSTPTLANPSGKRYHVHQCFIICQTTLLISYHNAAVLLQSADQCRGFHTSQVIDVLHFCLMQVCVPSCGMGFGVSLNLFLRV